MLVGLAATVTQLEQIGRGERNNAPWPTDLEVEFRDAFESLDGWLRRGGFLPDAWQR